MQTKYLTMEELGAQCPNIFTSGRSSSRSEKYVHIPTSRIIQDIMDMGWQAVDGKMVKSKSKEAGLYKKHLIQFEHPSFTTPDHNVRLLLTNSHDGSSNFKLDIGVFRLVCSNGLVVKSEDYGSIIIRHMGYTTEDVINAVNVMIVRAPQIMNSIEVMRSIKLTDEQMMEFALKSACIRFDTKEEEVEQLKKHLDITQLLGITRPEDSGEDLWTVYNRVQEKVINGDFNYTNDKGKVRKAREIKNIDRDMVINQSMWELASSYVMAN